MAGSFFRNGALINSTATTATAAGTTTLTASSATNQQFTGSTTQIVVLPDATTLSIGRVFRVLNRSSGAVTVNYNGGSLAATVAAASATDFLVISNGTSAGTWDISASGAGGTTSPLTTKGDLYGYDTANARIPVGPDGYFIKADSTQTLGLKWAPMTSGINYITNPDAEVDTSGWSAYSDAAGNTPVDATGGSPSSTWTRVTATPGRGVGSFLWTRTANNRQGEGVAYAFTTDAADKAAVLGISFDYRMISGTFFAADGTTAPLNDGTTSQNAGMSDLEVFVYDVTNSALIPVSPQVLIATGGTSYRFAGTFQTASSSTSYRLVLHTARSTAVAFTAQFDNFFVGPLSIGSADRVVAAKATSSTTTVGTSETTLVFPTVAYDTHGAYNSATGIYTCPVSGLYKVTLVTRGNATSSSSATAANNNYTGVYKNGALDSFLDEFTFQVSSNSITVTLNGSAIVKCVAGDTLNVVQLRGTNVSSYALSGSSVTNQVEFERLSGASAVEATDGRVVAMSADGIPATATSGNPIIYGNLLNDTHAGYSTSTGRYTTPVSGYYCIGATGLCAGTELSIDIYKNAAKVKNIAWTCTSGSDVSFSGSGIVFCSAGDIIDVRPSGSVSGFSASNTANSLNIFRLSGAPAQSATESVNFKYTHAAATAVTSITTIAFDTKVKDSHAAVSAGVFTAPSSGLYHFDVEIAIKGATFILNDLVQVDLVQAGSAAVTQSVKFYAAAAVTQAPVGIANELQLVAGDTVQVKVTSARTGSTLSGTVNENWFGGFRVGN